MKLGDPQRGIWMALTSALIWVSCLSGFAAPSEAAHLAAGVTPERLGQGTSIRLRFQLAPADRRVPPPLKRVDIRYPANFGIALSGLGIEACTAAVLETLGPSGCPPDSVMGYGSALGGIPFGPEIVREGAAVTIVRAEDEDGRIALLFDAEGLSPVLANIVLPGVLLPAPPPFGGDIHIAVPVVPSLPEAPDVAVLELGATIGPAAGLSYSEVAHGRRVSYTPKGILLPDTCPRGGFPFAASFGFQGGRRESAQTTVQCPVRASIRGRRRG
jgi:hypothetical protein